MYVTIQFGHILAGSLYVKEPATYFTTFYDYEIKKDIVEIMYEINASNTRKNISMVLETHRSILFFI
ncbi:hypothetical protein CON08_31190 [Bacillus cereus]|nr:hypothetical protein CON08_31190 [Bacillus cereus]